jgi:hypothetical protein
MAKKPTCVLCTGPLIKEKNAWIQNGGSNTLCYSLAWVCKDCGAAWPIAMTGAGLVSKSEQRWENGERAK